MQNLPLIYKSLMTEDTLYVQGFDMSRVTELEVKNLFGRVGCEMVEALVAGKGLLVKFISN